MAPVVSIVGKSGAGKTALMERLIAEFGKRGYRIAAVKHSHGMEIDRPGKDSWRFAQAGSEVVAVSSPEKLAFIRSMDHDASIEEILHLIGSGFDLVLVEGFKRGSAPKIEVLKRELGDDLLCSIKELSAVVSKESLDLDIEVPQFSVDDTQAIADFIEKSFVLKTEGDITLFINGKQVFMKPFVKDIIAKALLAMVSTLKGVREIRSLDISIRNKPGSTVTLSDSEGSQELSQTFQRDSSLRSE